MCFCSIQTSDVTWEDEPAARNLLGMCDAVQRFVWALRVCHRSLVVPDLRLHLSVLSQRHRCVTSPWKQ